jgi:hypothetical protein
MNVVLNPANGKGKHVLVFADSSNIGPQAWLEIFRNKFQSVLGAKNQMDVVLCVAVGHFLTFRAAILQHDCVSPPTGLHQIF